MEIKTIQFEISKNKIQVKVAYNDDDKKDKTKSTTFPKDTSIDTIRLTQIDTFKFLEWE